MNFGTANKKYQAHLQTPEHKNNIAAHWMTYIQAPAPSMPSSQQEGPRAGQGLATEADQNDFGEVDYSQEAWPQNHADFPNESDMHPQNCSDTSNDAEDSGTHQERREAAVKAAQEILREQDQKKAQRILEQGREILDHIESFRGENIH